MAEIDAYEDAIWQQEHPLTAIDLLRLALQHCYGCSWRKGRIVEYCLECYNNRRDGHKPFCWVGEAEGMVNAR